MLCKNFEHFLSKSSQHVFRVTFAVSLGQNNSEPKITAFSLAIKVNGTMIVLSNDRAGIDRDSISCFWNNLVFFLGKSNFVGTH